MKKLYVEELHKLQHEVLNPRNRHSPPEKEGKQPFKDCAPQHGDASTTDLGETNDSDKQSTGVNAQIEDNNIEDTPLCAQILTAYHKLCLLPLEQHPRIKKLNWNPKKRKRISEANDIACRITETYAIVTINNLNALYYAVVISLCHTAPGGCCDTK
eukprot:13614740-Ditylum_brightwellii.AAC.1